MARLTIAGVTAYAAECGYELGKVSYSYTLNGSTDRGIDGYSLTTLAVVVETIQNGYLLKGESSPLPDNQAIAQQELEQHIDDQAEQVEAQAQVKCIYPSCEQPCSRNCDSTLKVSLKKRLQAQRDFVASKSDSTIVHDCTPKNTSIYIDEITASPLGGYEIITAPPQMQRYEVPLLEKCLELEPEPTLADVIREFNDLPIFVSHLAKNAPLEEVKTTIILLSRYAERSMNGKAAQKDIIVLGRLRGTCLSITTNEMAIKSMYQIVCIYRDFRKEKGKV